MRSWHRAFWGRPAFPIEGWGTEGWEGRYARLIWRLPYLFLALCTILSQLQPYPRFQDRLIVIGLAVLAAMWVFVMFTSRSPSWRQRTGPMLVYFAGLLALCWLLESRSVFFLAFTIIGFFHAFLVFPVGLAFLGVAATSSVIYLSPAGSGWRDPRTWPILFFIIALETVTVGGGSFIGARVSEQQAKRKQLVADLEAALKENEGLHAQLVAQAREAGMLDERQRLAGEIHDTLAQGLTGIITQLEAAEQAREAPEAQRSHVERARALARESLSEARRSVQALRPQSLEDSRLPDALSHMARQWSDASSVPVSIETTGAPLPLPAELEVTLFRVAQEALANVAKHARASRVGLTVSYLEDMVLLDVRDDGVGFVVPSESSADSSANGNGYGLTAMRRRLKLVGGTLEIESSPGSGTAINASVPAPTVG